MLYLAVPCSKDHGSETHFQNDDPDTKHSQNTTGNMVSGRVTAGTVKLKMMCGRLCSQCPMCVGFNWEEATKTCELVDSVSGGTVAADQTGWTYYQREEN